jgi:PAS domain S-box-containing protein
MLLHKSSIAILTAIRQSGAPAPWSSLPAPAIVRGAPLLAPQLLRFSALTAALAIAAGALVLAGWAFGLDALKGVLPGLATMKANTAVAFMLCGVALWVTAANAMGRQGTGIPATRRAAWVVRACAAGATAVGLITLFEYASGLDFGLDVVLFSRAAAQDGTVYPGRMAPMTAASFTLLGIALLTLDRGTRGGRWPAQWLALVVAFGAFLALLGYAYGVELLYRVGPYSSMALHTALLFLLIPLALLCTRPGSGVIGLVTRDDAAGAFARTMLPAAVLVPVLLGWLPALAGRAGILAPGFGGTLVIACTVAAFTGLVCWSARSVGVFETARQQAAAALAASEARFRATIEAAPVGIVMADAAGTIVLANAEAEKLFGYAHGELAGESVERLVPEPHRSAHRSWREGFAVAPAMRRMGPGRTLRARRRDGSVFVAEIGLSPVATAAGTFVIATVLDMTENHRIEEELRQHATHEARQSEALRQSNLALQQFAYVASHDLQTPLRSIAGFAQLLQAEYAARLDERAADWLKRIVDSAGYMQLLIHDVLEYASVGTRAPQFERVDCREVFEAAVTLLSASIRELAAEVTCGELPVVSGERAQLVRLLENLIGNALKYHGSSAPRVHVSAERRGAQWEFAVRDNGIGIDPRHREQIFELFQRLHDQRDYAGTGIGLAVCRGIVERHGGRIWVESAPATGSIFRFTIPDRRENDE